MENSVDQNSTNGVETKKSSRYFSIPQTKIGIGSMEADLINLVKKYLEIVGLVVFVWILGAETRRKTIFIGTKSFVEIVLGYFHFSVSWILLAVFVYLFRQRQRILFKERHKMIEEMNKSEENYIKARLEELPSWVRRKNLR